MPDPDDLPLAPELAITGNFAESGPQVTPKGPLGSGTENTITPIEKPKPDDYDLEGPMSQEQKPDLIERFTGNMRSGFYSSVLGSSTLRAPGDEPVPQTVDQLSGINLEDVNKPYDPRAMSPEESEAAKDKLLQTRAALARYQAMPGWSGFAEGAAALTGQLVGAAPDPTNYVLPELPLGNAAWRAAYPVLSRILGVGAGGAAQNLVADPVVQANEIKAGMRDSYDPIQTAIGTGIGFGIGGSFASLENSRYLFRSGKDALQHWLSGGEGKPPISPELEAPLPPTRDRPPIPDEPKAVQSDIGGDGLPPKKEAPKRADEPPKGEELPEPKDEKVNEAVVIKFSDATEVNATFRGQERDGRRVYELDNGTTIAPRPDLVEVRAAPISDEMVGERDLAARTKDVANTSPARSVDEARPAGGITVNGTVLDRPQEFMVNLKDTMKKVADTLEVSVREGRLSARSATGQYDFETGIARLRAAHDYVTFAHEMAHRLEELLPTRELQRLWRQFDSELLPFDPARTKREQFAEYVASFVTNRQRAQQMAPNFTREFGNLVQRSDPRVMDSMVDMLSAFEAAQKAPSHANVMSGIRFSNELPEKRERQDPLGRNRVQTWANDFYYGFINKNSPAQDLDRVFSLAMNKILGTRVEMAPFQSVANLMKVFANGGQTQASADIMHGISDTWTMKAHGPALRDIIQEAMVDPKTGEVPMMVHETTKREYPTRLAQFESYLFSRHGLVEWDRYFNGELARAPYAQSVGDLARNKLDLEKEFPHFEPLAQKLYEMMKELNRKRFQAGLDTREMYDLKMSRADHYIPSYRDMSGIADEMLRHGGGKISLEDLRNFKFEGSDRRILGPVESIMKQIIDTNEQIARNLPANALVDFIERAGQRAMSHVAEIVPDKQLRAIEVDMREALMKKARETGMNDIDAHNFADAIVAQLGDDPRVTLWRNQPAGPNNKPIIYAWRDGHRVSIQLGDGDFGRRVFEMFDSIGRVGSSHGMQTAGFLVDLLAASASGLRTGATGTITFQVKNMVRDQLMQFFLMHEATLYNSITRLPGGLNEYFRTGDFYKMYQAGGGISGGTMSNIQRRARYDASIALKDMGVVSGKMVFFDKVTEASKALEFSETAGRVGLFKAVYEANRRMGRAEDYAAWDAAVKARDFVDYAQRGSRMEKTTALIPFLNANIQGLNKFFDTYGSKLWTEQLTAEGRAEQLALRKALLPRVAFTAAISATIAYMYHDDEQYQRIPDYARSSYWIFRVPGIKKGTYTSADGTQVDLPDGQTGAWVFIPKPWEVGSIFNFAERATQFFAGGGDTNQIDRWLKSLSYSFNVPSIFDNPLMKTAHELEANYSTFFDRPIVPDRLQKMAPQFQSTEYTSKFYVALAQALNYVAPDGRKDLRSAFGGVGAILGALWSPLEAEHLTRGLFGDWPREMGGMGAVANAMVHGNAPKLDDIPAIRAFIKDSLPGGLPLRDFWNQMSQTNGRLTVAESTYKSLVRDGRVDEAQAYYRSAYPDQKDYMRLQASGIDPDTRALHPLVRAKGAETALRDIVRQLETDGRVQSFVHKGEFIKTDPTLRSPLVQSLREIMAIEARNALILMGTKGYENQNIVDTKPYRNVIEKLAPNLANEISARYSFNRVYNIDTVKENWPKLQESLRANDLKDVSDIGRNAITGGFEFGGTGTKTGSRAKRFDAAGNPVKRGKISVTPKDE